MASGRMAGWQVLQWVIDALWPDGFGARLEHVPDEDALRQKIKAAAATAARRARRERAQATRTHVRSYASARTG